MSRHLLDSAPGFVWSSGCFAIFRFVEAGLFGSRARLVGEGLQWCLCGQGLFVSLSALKRMLLAKNYHGEKGFRGF